MKRKIGFFGGDSQTGTSMIARSFAVLLAETGNRVLYISGSGNYGDFFFSTENGKSLDDIKAAVRSGSVEKEEALQLLEQKKNLWTLPGVKNPLTVGHFPENTYETLLEPVEDLFDYVVIDGGSDPRCGITISAMNCCADRYFVITQQTKAVKRFAQCQKQVLQPLGIPVSLIINKYRKNPAFWLQRDIVRVIPSDQVCIIPWVGGGWQAEMEGKTLLGFPPFAKAVESLVQVYEPVKNRRGYGKRVFFRTVFAGKSGVKRAADAGSDREILSDL